MRRNYKKQDPKKYAVFILMSLLVLLTSVSLSMSSDKEPDVSKGYIGAATCRGCHEARYETYKLSVHSKKQVQGPEYKEACETCHGPGVRHVEMGGGRGVEIFDFGKKADPKAKSEKCLACHEETKHLVFWNMSKHKSAGVSCDSCHIAHSGNEKNLKAAQPELCYGCHRDIRAQANKQSHHPIKEGKISCSSCHDPHGSFGHKMVKADTVNELCTSCHAEKRGPYMFEHPPVEENCMNCHVAHGSNHNRLLVKKAPMLCQACHDWSRHPGTPYTKYDSFERPGGGNPLNNKLIARSCTNCHTNIHGSMGPSTNGRALVR